MRAIAQGVAALNAGKPAEAVGPFFAAIRQDPQEEQGWLGLALALTLEGRGGDLLGLVNHRIAVKGDGFLFIHALGSTILGYRLFAHLRGMAGLFAPDHPFRPPIDYALGCAALLEGKDDEAFAHFAVFKQRALSARSEAWPIGPESPFNIAYRQATLIEDRPWVDALGEGEPTLDGWAEPTFWDATAACDQRETPVLAAACDRHYFPLFAPGLVASLAQQMPGGCFHLHIVAPDDETRAAAADLAGRFSDLDLHFSSEPPSRYQSGAFYASNRFLIAPALRRQYPGRGLLLIDVDVEILAPLDPLYHAAAGFDHVGFRYDGLGPCSRYPAVATWWGTGAGATRLLNKTNRFLAAKLDIPWPFNWMLDQAALGSVRRWAGGQDGLALACFNDLTGQHFQPWLRPVGGDEKAALIRAAEGRGASHP